VGAERMESYLPSLDGKSVAIVANHTSLVDDQHIVDTLLTRGVHIRKIFSPEHGFRGDKDAGELVHTYVDGKTGLPVISLYGKRKKPKKEDLQDIDVVVFDIQDVGVRFYTYISTMHYVMEACAENDVKFIVLDRPNPNGFYIDGPVLDTQYRSFVGMHPIPLVYGMTIAELARMINGEGWLKDDLKCDLSWVPCANYTHDSLYKLPVRPSPNLPNMRSVYLYPSLGLFEGTIVNVGRGTEFPFQVYGHPKLQGDFQYTPRPIKGASMHPKHKNKQCKGTDLREYPLDSMFSEPGLKLEWLAEAYEELQGTEDFFLKFFTNLSGNSTLQEKIEEGQSIDKIQQSWDDKIEEFKKKREQYLIYEDF
jgi:uncharacterized protein YbbC (DUF1343 family)